MALVDAHGRSFHYLRLSVEDACNLRCRYCLPHGYHKEEAESALTRAEIRRLIGAFAGLGFWKVRLTGGEPTVRPDAVDLVADAAATPGVSRVALSTNGWKLAELAPALRAAGLDAVNVSADTLDRARFAELTGQDLLPRVLAGVDRALELGLTTKLNAVLMKGINDGEFEAFAARHLKAQSLVSWLLDSGWTERARREGDGPARAFTKPGHLGAVGVIAPYAESFCASCNRLRVTSRGRLRLCLFSEGEHSLRPLLQDDGQKGELQERVKSLLGLKEATHHLLEGRNGGVRHFAAMGG